MLTAGTLLAGRYEIVGRIGAGGMSNVYKAKDQKLNRFVAVKVLKPEFSADATFVKKFRVEAQSAAGLSHPNIVNVYDVGEEDGIYYIVMEPVSYTHLNLLKCHYCGMTLAMPDSCPECGSRYIGAFGMGTQKAARCV